MVPEAFEFELKEITSASMSRDETIQELLRRLVEFYQPERVYLFGSAARGEDGPDSDFDLCVVLPDAAAERLLRDRSIHERFWGLKAAVDVVRFASSDFDARAAHVAASLPASIMREGELLYDVRRIVLGQTVRSTAALLLVELDEQF